MNLLLLSQASLGSSTLAMVPSTGRKLTLLFWLVLPSNFGLIDVDANSVSLGLSQRMGTAILPPRDIANATGRGNGNAPPFSSTSSSLSISLSSTRLPRAFRRIRPIPRKLLQLRLRPRPRRQRPLRTRKRMRRRMGKRRRNPLSSRSPFRPAAPGLS